MDQLTSETFPKIERTAVDAEAMAGFTSESDFMDLTVRLAVETAEYVCIAASTTGPEAFWNRDQAAIGGNMVRTFKLMDAMLDQTCKDRGEMTFLLARLVFETVVNVQFLIQNFSTSLVNSYVEHSLRHEKKLWNDIAQRIVARNGILLPIEDRMQQSIERAFSASGMEIDDIDPKNKAPWGNRNLYQKAEAVGLDALYLSMFGGGSHSIHGSWEEIYGNHLNWDGSRFTANLEWQAPRPQLLLAICPVIIEAVFAYFTFISQQLADELIADPLTDLLERVTSVSAAHERYLAGKTWPEI
ncbi:hypothetical protein E0H35_12085 [Rhizobium leguminosarum bv. viciae]|uniref:DUF5677 domain-containing protein n=1 Tax=Rhizobium leguminosarum TaxID=384 RepID=UPI00103905F1|nr:DUF5677 domain-containing protein [Rhizobium leguminosarum]MBY5341458.1 hypothetical protein [Rhizobium leguminosarum]NKK51146.1 hypothetical protein [Rhizobium leguminosarum bv. viciae]TBY99890.1 hypothetical protein E0H35_12085 [Rhizobium leguminosarum bv. viciae]